MTRRGGALLALVLVACTPSASPSVNPTPGPSGPVGSSAHAPAPVVLAAGDIAACDSDGDEATAAMLDGLDGTILTLGDHAYPDGTNADFASCYDPSWGRHRDRTYPTPGNHEYETPGAAAYFAYFGERAGTLGEGWYSFDLGAWHLIALNSNCDEVGGCGTDSPQAAWLRADLAEHPAACTLAYWHHPRWSSSDEHGPDPRTDELWRILFTAGADLVLSGHDHVYERFLPMDADGAAAPTGLTQFVVGTGGRSRYRFGAILPTSAAHDSATYGVLQLTLHPDAYAWEFVSASGTRFADSGSADCR
ncbi:MAG: metallophosphoesterase family protein [Candidatus Limnocylindria bacterium]